MPIGPRLVLDLVAGITSLDEHERWGWADSAANELSSPYGGGIDDDEMRAVAPGHAWAMCIEPSARIRGRFLDPLDSFAQFALVSSTFIAEILGWLSVTGTDPRAEVDCVETFRRIVERTGAAPEVPLTPERSGPLVDVLRGITSLSQQERARAARIVPDLLSDLRLEEQWGFTGVLARAAVVEDDGGARSEQLNALAAAHDAGAVHAHDRHLLIEALTGVDLGTAERRVVDVLRGKR